MKESRLNNGVIMPAIGYGVYDIAPEITERCVSDALEVGYRMIDTAAAYLNEKEVGDAIRQSGIKRENLFVTTKLWVQDYEYEDALRAFDKSMELLGLDYLDLWLLHKPYGNYYAAWRAAEKLYKEGRIRAIGVTSFSDERLLDLIMHNEIKPMVNQIETNPWRQQKASNLFLKQEGIQQESWAPLAEGTNDIFNNPVLKAIADKHRKSVAQVVLRWLNQTGVVVLPRSKSREHIAENFDIFSFTLTPAEMDRIAALDTGKSTIYDENLLDTTRWIGANKIHD